MEASIWRLGDRAEVREDVNQVGVHGTTEKPWHWSRTMEEGERAIGFWAASGWMVLVGGACTRVYVGVVPASADTVQRVW